MVFSYVQFGTSLSHIKGRCIHWRALGRARAHRPCSGRWRCLRLLQGSACCGGAPRAREASGPRAATRRRFARPAARGIRFRAIFAAKVSAFDHPDPRICSPMPRSEGFSLRVCRRLKPPLRKAANGGNVPRLWGHRSSCKSMTAYQGRYAILLERRTFSLQRTMALSTSHSRTSMILERALCDS